MNEKKFSGFAIAGFVLSLLVYTSILGLIFSILALKQISAGKRRGKGLAVAGFVIGIVFVSIISITIIWAAIIPMINQNVEDISDNNENTSSINTGSMASDSYAELIHNDKLVILDYNSTMNEFGTVKIYGTAQNIAGKELSYAEIDAKFYDEEGAVLSTSLDNINSLSPNEKWKFEILYLEIDNSDVARYSLEIGSIW
jgi:hypothetical protein